MILNDWHLHTRFSADSDERMENHAEAAMRLGMTRICITDHYDMDYPTGEFQLDTEAYLQKLREMQETYRGRCGIFCGVEMGLFPEREAAEGRKKGTADSDKRRSGGPARPAEPEYGQGTAGPGHDLPDLCNGHTGQ